MGTKERGEQAQGAEQLAASSMERGGKRQGKKGETLKGFSSAPKYSNTISIWRMAIEMPRNFSRQKTGDTLESVVTRESDGGGESGGYRRRRRFFNCFQLQFSLSMKWAP